MTETARKGELQKNGAFGHVSMKHWDTVLLMWFEWHQHPFEGPIIKIKKSSGTKRKVEIMAPSKHLQNRLNSECTVVTGCCMLTYRLATEAEENVTQMHTNAPCGWVEEPHLMVLNDKIIFFQVGRQGYRKLCLRKSHWVFWDSTETMRYLSLCALCRPAVSWLRGLGHNYFFPLERLIRTAKVITLPPTPLWFCSCVTVSSIWWLAVPAGMKAKPAPSGQAFFFFSISCS